MTCLVSLLFFLNKSHFWPLPFLETSPNRNMKKQFPSSLLLYNPSPSLLEALERLLIRFVIRNKCRRSTALLPRTGPLCCCYPSHSICFPPTRSPCLCLCGVSDTDCGGRVRRGRGSGLGWSEVQRVVSFCQLTSCVIVDICIWSVFVPVGAFSINDRAVVVFTVIYVSLHDMIFRSHFVHFQPLFWRTYWGGVVFQFSFSSTSPLKKLVAKLPTPDFRRNLRAVLKLIYCLTCLRNLFSRASQKRFIFLREKFGDFGKENRLVKAACCGMQESLVKSLFHHSLCSEFSPDYSLWKKRNRLMKNVKF